MHECNAGWFKAGGGCMLAKRGSEGGFVATPAFTRSSPGEDLQSRLIYLNRHGKQHSFSSTHTCLCVAYPARGPDISLLSCAHHLVSPV